MKSYKYLTNKEFTAFLKSIRQYEAEIEKTIKTGRACLEKYDEFKVLKELSDDPATPDETLAKIENLLTGYIKDNYEEMEIYDSIDTLTVASDKINVFLEELEDYNSKITPVKPEKKSPEKPKDNERITKGVKVSTRPIYEPEPDKPAYKPETVRADSADFDMSVSPDSHEVIQNQEYTEEDGYGEV